MTSLHDGHPSISGEQVQVGVDLESLSHSSNSEHLSIHMELNDIVKRYAEAIAAIDTLPLAPRVNQRTGSDLHRLSAQLPRLTNAA